MPKIMTHYELLAHLVSFDTTSRHSNRTCIDFIRDYLDGFGIPSEIIPSDDGKKACLWATLGSSGKPGIVLAGHSDVVPVDGQSWLSDPFTLVERDGKYFARGACDMKGFIACALSVATTLSPQVLGKPLHLAFTYDEETTMAGATRLTEYVREKQIKPEWVWVGEPTDLHIIDQHKGVSAYSTRIKGIPGHSGQPDKGLNAIDVAVDFMSILRRVAEERRRRPHVPSRFDPPYTTMNLGIVRGGTAENIIAEHCEVMWQLRAHPGDEAMGFVDEVSRYTEREIKPRFLAFAQDATMNTCICFDIPPLMPTPNNPGQERLAALTGYQDTQAVSFATEAGFYQNLGSHVVVCGPGSINQAHQPNEFVSLEQLFACERLIRTTLIA